MKNRKKAGGPVSAPETFCAAGHEEELASIEGQLALLSLQGIAPPGQRRLWGYHKLRAAARLCPNAAYNLAMFLEQSSGPRRRKRLALAMRIYADAIELGCNRMRDPARPYDGVPQDEFQLRDIVSRAMTNVGAAVSNAGSPERATEYFRDAIRIFPDNPVSHDCLGNMGVWHADQTGVSRVEGIAAWHEAQRLGMWCHESEHGCPCKQNVISIAEHVLKSYGEREADHWIGRSAKIHASGRRTNDDFKPVFKRGADARKADPAIWTEAGAAAADLFADSLRQFASRPLEDKVTIVASALGSIATIGSGQGILPSEIVEMGLEAVERSECLHPFLGDDEWLDLAPPKTMRLAENQVKHEIMEEVEAVLLSVVGSANRATVVDLAMGLLFNVDGRFRHGVRSMVIDHVDRYQGDYFYMPAIYVGGARPS